jgi:hypothetical protein
MEPTDVLASRDHAIEHTPVRHWTRPFQISVDDFWRHFLDILLIAIGLPRQRIYLLKQQLNGITRGRRDLHGLSRSAISAIEELADRSNPAVSLFALTAKRASSAIAESACTS